MSAKGHTSKVSGCGCAFCSPTLEPGSKHVTLEGGCNLCGTTEGGLMPVEKGMVEVTMPGFMLRSPGFTVCSDCNRELRIEVRTWLEGLPKQLFRAYAKPEGDETLDIGAAVRQVVEAVGKAAKGGE